MRHRDRAKNVGRRLGYRPLVYFGPRGTDAKPLEILPNFERVICMIAPGDAEVETHCLEQLSGVRLELNGYSFDDDRSQAARTLHSTLRALGAGCVLLPYMASRIGSEIWITGRGNLEYLGPFDEAQAALAHKPWVESSLAVAGVRVLPWIYSRQPRPSSIPAAWRGCPLVVRGARSQGGTGLKLLRSVGELDELPPMADVGSYYSIGRLIDPAVPLNVNACVFPDGRTTLHGCSMQLIGLDLCTVHPFGFCGNDFGAVQALPSPSIRLLDTVVRTVGRWLAGQGYRGAFGIDALVDGADVYLVEVNARFQASSPLAATIDRQNDRSDQFLNHIASFLGLEPPDSASLCDLIPRQPARSQIFLFNTRRCAVTPSSRPASRVQGYEIDLVPEEGVAVDAGALLARVSTDWSVTRTGVSLIERAADLVTNVLETLTKAAHGINH